MTLNPYDIIVVGAGIIGAAIGERLAAAHLGRIIIVEKESSYCTGSSARSAGGIRQQFGDERKIRAAMFSMACFARFSTEYGEDPFFRKNGYLVLSRGTDDAARQKNERDLQSRLGLESYFLDPDKVKDVIPCLNTADLAGALYTPADGFLDPPTVVRGFINAFKARGGVLQTDTCVEELAMAGGRVDGVVTNRGIVRGRAVIVAAGPHSGPLLERMGVMLPLRSYRRQIFSTAPTDGVESHWPLVLDPGRSFYFRPESGGVIMSLAEVEEFEPPREGNEIPLSRDAIPDLARKASEICPPLAETGINGGWAGLRTLTPDELPVLGPIPVPEGLFVAAGFSGHGITLSFFAAEVLAAAVAGAPCRIMDPTPFSPLRFL